MLLPAYRVPALSFFVLQEKQAVLGNGQTYQNGLSVLGAFAHSYVSRNIFLLPPSTGRDMPRKDYTNLAYEAVFRYTKYSFASTEPY